MLFSRPRISMAAFFITAHSTNFRQVRFTLSHVYSVGQDPYGFWKVVEIENSIFQDLESFGKERIFKMAMEKFWISVWENSKNILKGV